MPSIDSVRLTIDCPRCGVITQEFFPDESSAPLSEIGNGRQSLIH
jgi:hypothetical protein